MTTRLNLTKRLTRLNELLAEVERMEKRITGLPESNEREKLLRHNGQAIAILHRSKLRVLSELHRLAKK